RPLELVRKALEEAGCGNCTRWAAAQVTHVGEVTLEQLLIFVEHRQAPGTIASVLSGFEQLLGKLVVVGEQAAGDVAQCNYTGAGQRGNINNAGRVESLCVGQSVSQCQAPLGVSVENLDGLA